MLSGFAYQDFDGRGPILGSFLLDYRLDAIPKQLSDDVLEMRRNVGKGRVQVSLQRDPRYADVWPISFGGEARSRLGAFLDDFLRIALQEDLPNKVVFGRDVILGPGEMPGGVEGVRQRQMLLGDDAPADSRTQERGDEAVALVGRDEILYLQNSHGQAGDDGQMISQTAIEDVAELVVVLQAAAFGYLAQELKRGVVELVHMTDVRVRQGGIGQGLHVAQSVGQTSGELEADIVGRTEQPALRERSTEEGELTETDRPRFPLHPVVQHVRRPPRRREGALRLLLWERCCRRDVRLHAEPGGEGQELG